jgi:predicted dehydrogenase
MTYKVLIVGFGAVAAGLSRDPRLLRHYRTITHAQSIVEHPAFELTAAVDPEHAARSSASKDWNIPVVVGALEDLPSEPSYDLAVIATPAKGRFDTIRRLPPVRAILLEKPLASSMAEAETIADWLSQRGIVCQTGYWRRADRWSRTLASGGLQTLIGTPTSVAAYYCRGFRNNASHLVDYIRMLLGEIATLVPVAMPEPGIRNNPDDLYASGFLQNGAGIYMSPIGPARENGLDIWGTEGRLEILLEGLYARHSPRRQSRSTTGESEIAFDSATPIQTTVSDAYYDLYDNIARHLKDGTALHASLGSTLPSMKWVDAVMGAAPPHRGAA